MLQQDQPKTESPKLRKNMAYILVVNTYLKSGEENEGGNKKTDQKKKKKKISKQDHRLCRKLNECKE